LFKKPIVVMTIGFFRVQTRRIWSANSANLVSKLGEFGLYSMLQYTLKDGKRECESIGFRFWELFVSVFSKTSL